MRYQYFHTWLNLTPIHEVHLSIDFASGGPASAESLRGVDKVNHSVISCSNIITRTCSCFVLPLIFLLQSAITKKVFSFLWHKIVLEKWGIGCRAWGGHGRGGVGWGGVLSIWIPAYFYFLQKGKGKAFFYWHILVFGQLKAD